MRISGRVKINYCDNTWQWHVNNLEGFWVYQLFCGAPGMKFLYNLKIFLVAKIQCNHERNFSHES